MKNYLSMVLAVMSLGLWLAWGVAETPQSSSVVNLAGPGFTPVTADFDGDGKLDLAVYQEESGSWFAALSGSGYKVSTVTLGGPGFTPLTGDFDGDRQADPAVYQETSGNWYARLSGSGAEISGLLHFGAPGYRPMPGDYNGNGVAEVAVYQRDSGNWYFLQDETAGFADIGQPGPSGGPAADTDSQSQNSISETPTSDSSKTPGDKLGGTPGLDIQFMDSIGEYPTNVSPIIGPATLTFSAPATGHSLSIVGRLGLKTNALWTLNLGNASSNSAVITLKSTGGSPPYNETIKIRNDTNAMALVSSPDVWLKLTATLPGPRKTGTTPPYFFKPDLNFYVTNGIYGDNERADMGARYPEFPSARTNTFTLRVEHAASGFDLWLDGRYLGIVPSSAGVTTGSVVLVASNELVNAYDWPALRTNSYLPLDLAAYARTGDCCRFVSEISGLTTSALNTVSNIPFFYGESERNIDVGLSRYLEESVGPGFCDNDSTRSALLGCPEAVILQVPTENIIAAHVLCAVEPSTNKVPVLSLRVTRFGRHYGDSGGRCDEAFADTTVVLPASTNDALPDNVIQVGEINAEGLTLGDSAQTLPVYLVTVPLKMGEIPDLLDSATSDYNFGRGNQYLELELTKSIRLYCGFRKPLGAPSAAHVFGVTLERNPVDTQISSPVTNNMFYLADSPALNVGLTNARDTNANTVTVSWELTDYYGGKTTNSTTAVVPGTGGGATNTSFSLPTSPLGYYDAVITVTENSSGRELWRQPTSFVLLPPDTRTAGSESPFGTWWFCGIHGANSNVSVMGPILMKMGMRHICPNSWTTYEESDLTPYKLSFSMAGYRSMTESNLNVFIGENPNIRLGMIFHEHSIPAATEPVYPYAELHSGSTNDMPALNATAQAQMVALFTNGEARGAFYRTNYPDIKITVGNSHGALLIQIVRHEFPTQYIDCLAMEGLAGFTTTECQPESGYMQEVWWVREIQRIYGRDNIPVSSGYEYITRNAMLGSGITEREQAELYIRDALHCLAYGYLSINIGSAEDMADSYNSTMYGGGGFVRRSPLLNPKPAYAAWATMTQQLDGSEYVRYLDTGSRGLYALEFQTANSYIYPIWTVRGTRQLTATVADASVSLTDGMGNTTNLVPSSGQVTLEATTLPMYLVTTSAITNSITPGAATYEEVPIFY